jgi:hypothetical protein
MITNHPSDVLCPLPRRIERVRVSITSPLVQPSPNGRRVGIRIVTFEACSGFTRVTARRIAQPPKVTFVTRLRSRQLPSETARQLPDLSTIIRVEPSSTDDSRLQGALPTTDISFHDASWGRSHTHIAAVNTNSLARNLASRITIIYSILRCSGRDGSELQVGRLLPFCRGVLSSRGARQKNA